MKTAIAWLILHHSFKSRGFYAVLGDLGTARTYGGSNPIRTLFDGVLLTLVGLLIILQPLVNLLLAPGLLIHAWFWCRKDYLQLRQHVKAGEFCWTTGQFDLKNEEGNGQAQ